MRISLLHIVFSITVMLPVFATAQKKYSIHRITDAIAIDGEVDDAAWADAGLASDFVTNYPEYGTESRYVSKVRLCYDDKALYVAGELFDPSPDSVSYSLSQRDDVGNADRFGITLDPYAANTSSFAFIVTAAGVEIDGLLFTNGSDFSWNAVWKSSVKKQDYGWSFEMKIPFSALRFPNKSVQEWNINFVREVRRDREKSFWNPVNPSDFGEITQSGVMKGMSNVKSPVRLSFTPYATGYLENSYDYTLEKQVWKSRLTGGLDLKYGLNDAFTLDMTLIPDFGQTTSDKQVLNLGPFEVRFDENRPFFLEGTDLFSIGNVFYSRRIGAQPYNYSAASLSLADSIGEEVISNPDLAALLNGTKVSGRTKSGLGIGVFNAIEGELQAIVADSNGVQRVVNTHPLTNYNVFVLSQNLQNNSSVSFVNTNVMRAGANRDANVSVIESSLFSKDGRFNINSGIKISSVFEGETPVFGHSASFVLEKVSGTWGYALDYFEESDTYDPNDLGFLYNNNERFVGARLNWRDFEANRWFLRRWADVGVHYAALYKPQVYANSGIDFSGRGTTKNFTTIGVNGTFRPFNEVNHFESREFGKEVGFGSSGRISGFVSTDYSKKFALDVRSGIKQFFGSAMKTTFINVSPRMRVSDKMFLVLRSNWEFITHDFGYVSSLDENYSDEILMGYRNRRITENSIQLEYIFTKRMGVDLRLRHYWQQVEYNYFKELLDEGNQVSTTYLPLNDDGESAHNTNYNAFTLDLNYRWVFTPGSELRIVYKNNIFNSQNTVVPSYFNSFDKLFDQPQTNSISMKLLLYIDVLYFKRKNRNR